MPRKGEEAFYTTLIAGVNSFHEFKR